ncbi:peptidase M50B-like-domain-containing protein [Rhodotorula diobovata]|uniref:Peptidase M50B-like-domain-containing protein n=1 Tax=Rhodotorula diobovata TaxID=5288 RepID=A0A5C5G2H9_9BASI|nr:peptidase M50B-like-domain-containing protein [Rhodotorula diobovata]
MPPAPYLLVRSPLDLAPQVTQLASATARPASSSTLDQADASVAQEDELEILLPRSEKRALAEGVPFGSRSSSALSKTRSLAALNLLSPVEASAYAPNHTIAKRSLAPNDTQKVTLGVIGAYAVVITILWNLPVVHWVLWPFKLLVVAFHEFSHAAVGCCTGAKVKSITLDPREGGCTMMAGGVGALTLPAGYLGSSLIGALLVFCGFDVVASKVASIVVGVMFLLTLWWGKRDWLTILTILLATGLIVACWFIAHGVALRFYMLFLGVMNSLYSLYDICDDLIFRKVNESDASVFAKRYGGSSVCWGVLWFIVSLAFLAVGIVAGLAAFKDSFSEQATKGSDFLPTRF